MPCWIHCGDPHSPPQGHPHPRRPRGPQLDHLPLPFLISRAARVASALGSTQVPAKRLCRISAEYPPGGALTLSPEPGAGGWEEGLAQESPTWGNAPRQK